MGIGFSSTFVEALERKVKEHGGDPGHAGNGSASSPRTSSNRHDPGGT